jgi:hypothetical protein
MNRRQLTFRALIAVLLVLPLLAVVFTEGGQRRTDLLLVNLFGNPTAEFALDGFSPVVDEGRMKRELPQLTFDCANVPSPFGERACRAPLGAFNGIPANQATFFFAGARLNAVELVYARAYHNFLRESLIKTFGEPMRQDNGVALLRWNAGEGNLNLLAERPGPGEAEPALLWLAGPVGQ